MIIDALQLFGLSWMDPNALLQHFGQSMFWISLLIVFVECGLFFPVLPGDTLLFAMGIFLASDEIKIFHGGHHMDLPAALVLFTVAAFLGNVSGYEIGRLVGPPLAQRDGRILKKKYFDQTGEFFDKHGNKALVIGRFVPFVRTYITVVAGITQMDRRRFLTWSAVGAVLWVASILLLGFFLGTTFPWLRDRIDLVILAILAFSAIPVGIEWLRHRRKRGALKAATPAPSDVEV
ncbi:DedA family protein [Nocardioides marmorisolisilvae]|nr:VTT domain-containing protein [Nocardioides marmorisolisilvae]